MVSLSHDARPKNVTVGAGPAALAGVALALALAFLYAPLWEVCWRKWWEEGSAYSHGILIPPLAGMMIWWRQSRWKQETPRPALGALAPLVLGLALQLFARWAHSTMFSWASFLLLVTAGIAFMLGWRIATRLLPPVLFLTFMVPMSAMLTQPLIFGAQMFSTRIADTLLHGMGFNTQLLGTIIQLDNYTLQVAVPCSGFKTLIALAAFASCFIYLLDGSLPKKLFLFGAAMILGLMVNGLRISLVGVAGELVNSATATWVHDNGGLPVTALALGGLFLIARMMKCSLAAPGSPS